MWVADERKDEYIRAGHKLALDSAKPKVADEEEPKVVKPKKATKKAPGKKK